MLKKNSRENLLSIKDYMSHYHCELWIPEIPYNITIQELVNRKMAPFCLENNPDHNTYDSNRYFWDFNSIGGRWSGIH